MLFILLLPLLAASTAHVQKSWTIEELTSLRFPYESTNDQYLDVCKAGEYNTYRDVTQAPVRFACQKSVAYTGSCKSVSERARHKSRRNSFFRVLFFTCTQPRALECFY